MFSVTRGLHLHATDTSTSVRALSSHDALERFRSSATPALPPSRRLETILRGLDHRGADRIEIIERLASAAEYRDHDTTRHTERVGTMAARLASALGMALGDVGLLQRASALHDVGKIGIPDALLLKPGPLTEEEMTVMRTHTLIGAQILGGSDAPLLQLAELIALSHHEWWDGSGYPNGLKGNAIPLCGRIVAVADAFDVVTNDRPYRKAQSVEAGVEEIVSYAGSQFDPRVVEALLRVISPQAGDGQA